MPSTDLPVQLREWADNYPPTFGDKYAEGRIYANYILKNHPDARFVFRLRQFGDVEHGVAQQAEAFGPAQLSDRKTADPTTRRNSATEPRCRLTGSKTFGAS